MRIPVELIIAAGVGAGAAVWLFTSSPSNRSLAVASDQRLFLLDLETDNRLLVQGVSEMFCDAKSVQGEISQDQQRSAGSVVKLVPGSMGGDQGEKAVRSCQGASGVYLGRGLLLTNAHVVLSFAQVNEGNPVEMYAVTSTGQTVRAQTFCLDGSDQVGWDMAIVQLLQPVDIPAAPLAQAEAQVGESVAAIGFPLGQADAKLSGVIPKESPTLAIPDKGGEEQSLNGINRLDAALKYGYSGGGSFNENGELQGLIVMGTRQSVSEARSGELAGSWMIGAARLRQFFQRVIDDRSYCRVGG